MKITIPLKSLLKALEVVSVVTPDVNGSEEMAGYRVDASGETPYLVVRGKNQMASAELEDATVEDKKGGDKDAFILPVTCTGSLKHLGDTDITFMHGREDAGDAFWVSYETSDGAQGRVSSLNPMFVPLFQDDMGVAEANSTQIPAGILREALSMAKPYTAKNDRNPHLQTVQIFDSSKESWAKGNGHMFASTGIRLLDFYADVFKDTGLKVHADVIPVVLAFLGKCKGAVTLCQSESSNYLVDSEKRVLGWKQHLKAHEKYADYPDSRDNYILGMPVSSIVQALKYVRAGMGKKQDRARIEYNASEQHLVIKASGPFGVITSFPVKCTPEATSSESDLATTKDLALNVDINFMMALFDSLKGHQTALRVYSYEKNKKSYGLLRTVDTFFLTPDGKVPIEESEDSVACTVSRYMPSRD